MVEMVVLVFEEKSLSPEEVQTAAMEEKVGT
jgi:hypothetical protein